MCNVPSQSDLKAFWSQESPEGTYIYFDFFHADRHLHGKKPKKQADNIDVWYGNSTFWYFFYAIYGSLINWNCFLQINKNIWKQLNTTITIAISIIFIIIVYKYLFGHAVSLYTV